MVTASSVHMPVGELFLGGGAYRGDLDLEVEVLAGERVITIERHHVATYLGNGDGTRALRRLRLESHADAYLADAFERAPRYTLSGSDAKSVQILRTEPKAPHDRLGEVVVDASTDPPPSVVEIEQKMCQAAAKMGANAVVIVLDRVQPVAAYVTGPYWGRSIESVSGRKVIGIAIRFRQ